MKSGLFLLALLAACAPPPDLNLTVLSLADELNPTVDLELLFEVEGRQAFLRIEGEPIPITEPLFLPEGFKLLPLHIEVRALVGAREIARGAAEVAPGQTEATIRFAVCSNGAIEAEEPCDDANLTDGDGCDSTCKPTGCASGVPTAGELCFAQNDSLIGPDNPLQVLAADLDGDELPDLVAPYGSLNTPSAVRVFSNAGGFGAFQEIPVLGVKQTLLRDMDGDGDLDIVASVDSGATTPGIVILTNEEGTFVAGAKIPISAQEVGGLTLEDLNGDGRLDLVYTDKPANLLNVLFGAESGFQGGQVLGVGTQPIALELADLDLDGDPDALTLSASGSVTLLTNEGGFLGTTGSPLLVGGVPSAFTLGEFDSLPGLDLAVTKQENGAGKVKLFKNVGGKNMFQEVGNFELGTQPSALIAADLDSDGDLDLAATNQTDSQIQVLFNNGGGQFDPPQDATGGLFETRLGPVSLAVSDLNGDGAPDLVAAGQNLGLLLSNP